MAPGVGFTPLYRIVQTLIVLDEGIRQYLSEEDHRCDVQYNPLWAIEA